MLFFVVGTVFAGRKGIFGEDCMDCAYDWACHDRTMCKDTMCSDWQAARRAGFICEEFPWYQGGWWPFDDLDYESESQYYTCLTNNQRRSSYETIHDKTDSVLLEYYDDTEQLEEKTSANRLSKSSDRFEGEIQKIREIAGFIERRRTTQTYCDSWEWYDASIRKFGECACSEEDESGNFCAKWRCWKAETAGCEYYNCLRLNRYTCKCDCDSWGNCNYNRTLPLDYDYKDCSCTHASQNSTYCKAWNCEWMDVNETSTGEYEDYSCTEDEQYCTRWLGDMDGAYNFKKSSCYCKIGGDDFCEEWACDQKMLPYVYPTPRRVWIPIVISVVCTCFAFCCRGEDSKCGVRYFFIFAVIILVNLFLAALNAGVFGMIVLVAVWISPCSLVCLFVLLCRIPETTEKKRWRAARWKIKKKDPGMFGSSSNAMSAGHCNPPAYSSDREYEANGGFDL